MRLAGGFVVVLLVARAAAAQTVPTTTTAPGYPRAVLAADEEALKGVFPSTAHWLSRTGVPVTVLVVTKNDKIIVRGYVGTKQQDLATSAFPEGSMTESFVFDHEDGKTFGVQLHQYIDGAPDKYEGWNVQLVGETLKVVRTTRFNGNQPQPDWLIDNVKIKNWKSLRRAVQVLRSATYDADTSAWSKYVDDESVAVTWRERGQQRTEKIAGTELLARLGNKLPLVGHNATCTALCCRTDGKELWAWTHVARVCFDAEPKPEDIDEFAHIRSIEIVGGVLPN